jgi:tetratricopeptide (TPR) repeat protein
MNRLPIGDLKRVRSVETPDSITYQTNEVLMKSIPALITIASLLFAPICPAETGDPIQNAMAGTKLSAEQAEELETVLEGNPDDLTTRTKLLGYYFPARHRGGDARAQHRKHVLWVVRNHPGSDLAALPYCELNSYSDPEGFVEAKKLWLKQIEAHPQDPKVLGNAGTFFTIQDMDLAAKLLTRAQQAEPNNPAWADKLGHLFSMSNGKDAAARSLEQFEISQTADKEEMTRFYRLDSLAKAAFRAGHSDKAAVYAQESLAAAKKHPKDWNHGNALHHGNNVLGLCALQQGDTKLAASYLIKAGMTPGSPQLNSFGPNMLLAKALLENGAEKDAVVEYFELCRKFWKSGGDRLDRWTRDVNAGNIPEFGGNLRY